MVKDTELLEQYARAQSESAFAELGQRHLGLVVVAGVALPVWQRRQVETLRRENQQLRTQAAPAAPTPSPEGEPSRPAADVSELTRLRTEQERLKLELARLRNMAGVARRAEAEAAGTPK